MSGKSYADTVREHSAMAKQTQRSQLDSTIAEEQRRLTERLRELKDGGFDSDIWPKWKAKIDSAAGKGEEEVVIDISSNSGHDNHQSPECSALISVGLERLNKMGFEARESGGYEPRCGSDDDYGDTTYFTLTVSWKKAG